MLIILHDLNDQSIPDQREMKGELETIIQQRVRLGFKLRLAGCKSKLKLELRLEHGGVMPNI
jgi:hypothetical protein